MFISFGFRYELLMLMLIILVKVWFECLVWDCCCILVISFFMWLRVWWIFVIILILLIMIDFVLGFCSVVCSVGWYFVWLMGLLCSRVLCWLLRLYFFVRVSKVFSVWLVIWFLEKLREMLVFLIKKCFFCLGLLVNNCCMEIDCSCCCFFFRVCYFGDDVRGVGWLGIRSFFFVEVCVIG